MTIWHKRIACWMPKATNKHTGCVILTDVPLLQCFARTLLNATLNVLNIACLISDVTLQLVHYLRPQTTFPASLNIGQGKLFKIIVTSFRQLTTNLRYWIIIQPIWTCNMRLCRCKKPSNVQIIKRFQSKAQRALEHSLCYIASLSLPLKFAYHLSNMETENLPRLVTSMYFRTATTL